MIRVVCVEDKPVLLEFLVQTISDQENLAVIAACSNVATATSKILETKPDIVILDIGLPDGNGLDMMKEIMKSGLNTKFIIYTIYSHSDMVKNALQLGAFSYILKTATPAEIVATINTVYETDNVIIPPEVLQMLLPVVPSEQADKTITLSSLSITERQILKLLKENMSYADIASSLQISINTVRYYIKNIYKKLNIQSRYEIK
jgi:DNA-binding NarL/FixJ family response regulator